MPTLTLDIGALSSAADRTIVLRWLLCELAAALPPSTPAEEQQVKQTDTRARVAAERELRMAERSAEKARQAVEKAALLAEAKADRAYRVARSGRPYARIPAADAPPDATASAISTGELRGMESACAALVERNSSAADMDSLAECCRVLRVLLGNIVKHPGESKYRRLLLANPKLHAAIGRVPGGLEVLRAVGFCPEADAAAPSTTSVLVLAPDVPPSRPAEYERLLACALAAHRRQLGGAPPSQGSVPPSSARPPLTQAVLAAPGGVSSADEAAVHHLTERKLAALRLLGSVVTTGGGRGGGGGMGGGRGDDGGGSGPALCVAHLLVAATDPDCARVRSLGEALLARLLALLDAPSRAVGRTAASARIAQLLTVVQAGGAAGGAAVAEPCAPPPTHGAAEATEGLGAVRVCNALRERALAILQQLLVSSSRAAAGVPPPMTHCCLEAALG